MFWLKALQCLAEYLEYWREAVLPLGGMREDDSIQCSVEVMTPRSMYTEAKCCKSSCPFKIILI